MVILEDALIPEEVTKECLKCKDKEAMAEAIVRLLSDRDHWASVSAASKAYASNFTWSKAAINTRKVYADVLGHD